jgi:ATP-dependent Clp protease ATP-binding subunit ClpX
MQMIKCSFCGSPKEQVKKLVAGSENTYICDRCAEMCIAKLENDGIKSKPKNDEVNAIPTPMEIRQSLDEYVIGQDMAKKVLSVAAHNHYKRISATEISKVNVQKSNILLLGPSGTGKTYLVQTMAKILKVPFAIADATSLTEAGYVGDDVESVLSKLYQAADGDMAMAQRGIVYIDEIDKIARRSDGATSRGDVSVQRGLLKIIEGTIASVTKDGGLKRSNSDLLQMDTTDILFICGGAFVGIDNIIARRQNCKVIGFKANDSDKNENEQVTTKDLQEFGFIPEIIGRLPTLATLDALDESTLVRILTEPKDSIVKQYSYLFELGGTILEFTEESLAAIARQAMEKGIGARGLRAIMEGFMTDIMYYIPSKTNVDKVIITRETVTDGKEPEIIYK